MRIVVAQLNPTIGDLEANLAGILEAWRQARARGADLVVAPELAICGYPPRDLLDRAGFVRDTLAGLRRLVDEVGRPALITGCVVSAGEDILSAEGRIANGAVLIMDNAIHACHRKILLPTYDVFDEERYFVPGTVATVAQLDGLRLGINICEDIWNDKDYWFKERYEREPVAEQVTAGAQLLVNVSASPYEREKPELRRTMLARHRDRHRVAVLYVNQVGGNDSLLFDGRSMALGAVGAPIISAPAFAQALMTLDFEQGNFSGATSAQPAAWEQDVAQALAMGLKDYVHKCGFTDVVLGLSGGIDSAVTATLAVKALGPQHVIGVAMPSRHSSKESLEDAHDLAQKLGIRLDVVSIEPMYKAYLATLAPAFAGRPLDVTEENLQARIRGAILMAYSNKLGALLLTTGNKSELAVGYSTLYGDMCGGLAVISDVYKTDIYALAAELNHTFGDPIPQSSILKPPSAELRDNQTDQDSLPPYVELDAVLREYVDNGKSAEDIVAQGLDALLVQRVVTMVDRAEYKRRQMPPGLRVSHKAFGEGRRLPIAQRYRGTPVPGR
jgi:NAD+ synthase (glutamine-hydrolysing)